MNNQKIYKTNSKKIISIIIIIMEFEDTGKYKKFLLVGVVVWVLGAPTPSTVVIIRPQDTLTHKTLPLHPKFPPSQPRRRIGVGGIVHHAHVLTRA